MKTAKIVTQLQRGDTTVTILTIGELLVRLADWLRLPEDDWPPAYRDQFAAPIQVPVQSVHIARPGRSVLIDPCHPELLAHAGDLVPGAAVAPGLLAQLVAIGADPDAVDAVVITHPHFDHYCGMIDNDGHVLFPNARHFLGRADWELLQAAMAGAALPQYRAFEAVQSRGLLHPVDGPYDLGDGMRIIATPGETPGHQAVRVELDGTMLYILGDLYHHEVEVEHPQWGVYWAEAESITRSRAAISAAALTEDALFLATHIAGFGRMIRSPAGHSWVTLEEGDPHL
jgi:glyoxylase-like metal-dependent hydrolase (beta-lactamase superfamily II)